MTYKECLRELSSISRKCGFKIYKMNTSIEEVARKNNLTLITTFLEIYGTLPEEELDTTEVLPGIESEIEKLQDLMDKKVQVFKKYGPGTVYTEVFKFFRDIDLVDELMHTNSKYIIQGMVDRVNIGVIMSRRGENNFRSSHLIRIRESEENSSTKMIDLDSIIAKLPTPSIQLADFMVTYIKYEIVEELKFNYRSNSVLYSHLYKTYCNISTEINSLISADLVDAFKNYSISATSLIDLCGSDIILYLAIPDYANISEDNLNTYQDCWPFTSRSILSDFDERLRCYRIDAMKLKKLALLGNKEIYKGIPLVCILGIRALYDLIHSILEIKGRIGEQKRIGELDI